MYPNQGLMISSFIDDAGATPVLSAYRSNFPIPNVPFKESTEAPSCPNWRWALAEETDAFLDYGAGSGRVAYEQGVVCWPG